MTLSDTNLLKFFRLINTAFRGYRFKITAMTILGLGSGVLEGVGINSVIPLFSFAGGGHGQTNDSISQIISRLFTFLHLPYTLKFLLIFIASLFVAKAALLFFNQFMVIRIMTNYEKQTRGQIFKLMLQSNWPHLSKQKVGYLDQVLLTDIDRSSGIPFHMGGFFLATANLLIYSLLIINISVSIALLALAFGLLVLLVFKPLFYRTRAVAERMTSWYKEMAHFINEHVIGIKAIKASVAERSVSRAGDEHFERMRTLRTRMELIKSFNGVLLQPVALLFILGIFAYFYKTSAFNFASFAVVVYAINKVFGNIQLVQGELHDLISRLPHLASVMRYKEETIKHVEIDHGIKPFQFTKQLEFQSVSFAYANDQPILLQVNLVVGRGEYIGLVGPSGAGKTTIVDLLLRLLQPQSGNILLDGLDSSQITLPSWRESVGYVAQEPVLINDTIYNNITFFDPRITAQDVREACATAQCLDFIQELPQGLNTFVGERGTRLSGGQRQRIALARVLARHPQILVLDEATSALDNESELLIQKAIERLRGKITVIAIAHRLTTLAEFDRIVVLEHGRVLEQGPPSELLKNPQSYFARLYYLRSNNETKP